MLTEYMQRRAVWELVYGKPERTPAVEQFEEPWRTLYLVAERHLEQGKSASDALGQAAPALSLTPHSRCRPTTVAKTQSHPLP